MIDGYDVDDLACVVLGVDASDNPDLDQLIFDKFDIGMEQFSCIVEALIPYTIPAKSPLTGTVFQGFVTDGAFIVKQEAMV